MPSSTTPSRTSKRAGLSCHRQLTPPSALFPAGDAADSLGTRSIDNHTRQAQHVGDLPVDLARGSRPRSTALGMASTRAPTYG
jgi:hypothetical protein